MEVARVLHGSLAEQSFPDLAMRMHGGAETGALVLRRDASTKTVYFRSGRIVFARSTHPDDRLGEFLLRRGVISLAQYLESARGIVPGRRQGAVLCEMGAIAADDLVRHVTEQVTEILYSLFSWDVGTWEVRPGDEDAPELIELTIAIEEVILGGARRMVDWSRIWRGLDAGPEAVFRPTRLAEGLAHRAAMSEDELHVLSLVSGKMSLQGIIESGYTTSFETCRLLWAFRKLGAIEPLVPGSLGPEGEDWALAELVEEYDRVLTHVHGFVTERIGDLVDHFMDRALGTARPGNEATLAGVHLRNQGRVEYEQIFTNLAAVAVPERHRLARSALDAILATLVDLTARELGPDEASELAEGLRELAGEVPSVPVAAVLARAAGEGR